MTQAYVLSVLASSVVGGLALTFLGASLEGAVLFATVLFGGIILSSI